MFYFNKTYNKISFNYHILLQLLSHFSVPLQDISLNSSHIHCLHLLPHILPLFHANKASATTSIPRLLKSKSSMASMLPHTIITSLSFETVCNTIEYTFLLIENTFYSCLLLPTLCFSCNFLLTHQMFLLYLLLGLLILFNLFMMSCPSFLSLVTFFFYRQSLGDAI